ncbi:alkyl sulfatase C-terminal domain-containing protein, partial [Acinetobacter baumannii]
FSIGIVVSDTGESRELSLHNDVLVQGALTDKSRVPVTLSGPKSAVVAVLAGTKQITDPMVTVSGDKAVLKRLLGMLDHFTPD